VRTHTIEVTERELRAILSAFDYCRDETLNGYSRWWTSTKYVNALYLRLRSQGL
jgi:hypothetical protein